MKNTFFTFLCISGLFVHAQTIPDNPCAASKIHHYQRSYSDVIDAVQIALEAKYDMHYAKIDLGVTNASLAITGNVILHATATQALDTFGLELDAGLAIDSAFLNGTLINNIYRGGTDSNDLDLILPTMYSAGAQLSFRIYYHGTRQSTGTTSTFYGINNGYDQYYTHKRYTFTLSDPYGARQWWPSKQALNDKLDSSEVDITTDDTLKVGSNGLLVNSIPQGGGKIRYEWKNQYPIDYYLIFFTVGKFMEYDYYAHPPIGDSVFVQNYIYDSSTLVQVKANIDYAGKFLDSFSVRYGEYPYRNSKFGHVMTPFGGGMENETMIAVGYISFADVAHELTHQWFGDLVTNVSFQDVWLNEGFAVYGEYLGNEIFTPGNKAAYMAGIHTAAMVTPDGSVYCTDTTSFIRIFSTQLTYKKAASVVHMLRYLVNNDSMFYAALRYYLGLHAFGYSQTDTFHHDMEDYTGLQLNDFFDQWVYGQGYPTYTVTWNWNRNMDTLYVQNVETVSSVTPLFNIPVEYKIHRKHGTHLVDTIVRMPQNSLLAQFVFPTTDSVISVTVDPNDWLLDGNSSSTKDTTLYFVINGITAPVEASVKIYPNPVTNILSVSIDGIQDNIQAQVFGADGRLWQTTKVANGNNRLNTAMLPAGMYILRLTGADVNKTMKFVKE